MIERTLPKKQPLETFEFRCEASFQTAIHLNEHNTWTPRLSPKSSSNSTSPAMASPSPSGSSSPSSLQLPTTSSPRRRPSLIAAGTGPSLDGEQLLPPVSSTDFGGSGQAELLRPRSASGFGSSKSETGKSRKSSSNRRLSGEAHSPLECKADGRS